MTVWNVPGEISPDDLPKLPQDKIVGMMPPPLRTEWEAVNAALTREEGRNLETEYALGMRIKKVMDASDKYGTRAVPLLAAASGVDITRLYRAARFVSRFPDRAAVEGLMARRGAGGYRVGWAHLIQLLPVLDDRDLQGFVDAAFAERLTVRELADLVRRDHDARTGKSRGTVRMPTDLRTGLNSLRSMAEHLRGRIRDLLPEVVVGGLDDLPPDQIDDRVIGQVAALRGELAGVAEIASAGAAELARVEQDLAGRVPVVGPVADEAAPSPAEAPAPPTTGSRRARRTRRPVEA